MSFRALQGVVAVLAASFAVTAVAVPPAAPATEPPLDGYAAIVNDRVITVGDVMDLVQPTDLQLRDAFEGEELARKREEAYQTALDLLIDQALILEEFKKQGATIPDRLVSDRINELIFQRFQNDRAKFLAALAEEQMTLDEWQERTRERIIVSYLRRQEVLERVKIPPGAVRAAYDAHRAKYLTPEQIKLRMLSIKKQEDDTETQARREQAVVARGRIVAGEAFDAVAREVSEDPKATSGGDWGWIEPKMLRAELKAAAEALGPGELSDLIETPDAFYVLQVEDRKAAREQPFEEVRDGIEKELRSAEAERLYSQWIDRLKRKHFVKVF